MKAGSPSPIPRSRALGILVIILSAAVLSGCSSSAPGFRWSGLQGEVLAFSSGLPSPDSSPAVFGKAHLKGSFSLKKSYTVRAGSSLAVRVRSEVEGTVLALGWTGRDRQDPRLSRFSLSPGFTTFYLGFGEASEIKAFTILLESPGGAIKDEELRIESVRFEPGFVGYAKESDGVRISDGISIKKSDKGYSTWVLNAKAAGTIGASSGAADADSGLQTLTIRYQWNPGTEFIVRTASGTSLRLGLAPAPRTLHLPLAMIPELKAANQLSVLVPDDAGLEALFLQSLSEEEARTVDPAILLSAPDSPEGEDFSWFRWDLFPDVLMFDFKSYEIQDRYLKRLAFFVEKKGFVGKLATNAEMGPLHGWNAHDYRAEDLARYFTLAAKTGFSLNSEEESLREFLIKKKVIFRSGKEFTSGQAAILSISRESPDYLRRMFLTHEASHAIFFSDDKYRDFCIGLWSEMDPEEKWFWKLYFNWMNYNTSSSYLMANEMQGYLVQQGIAQTKDYFTKVLVERVIENHEELIVPISEYMARYAESFEARARQLDDWLKARYGLRAGRMYFLR